MRTTRQEIHRCVWAEPMSEAARRFRCSDVRLGRICQERAIPRPGRGYWSKPLTRRGTPPALPTASDGRGDVVLIGEGKTCWARSPARNAEAHTAVRMLDGRWSALSVDGLLKAYAEEHVREQVVGQQAFELARKRLAAHFGPLRPHEIQPSDVRAYEQRRRSGDLGGRHGRKAGDGIIRRDLSVLVAALNHAVREGRLRRGLVPHIQLPPAGEPRQRWLDEQERGQLLEAAHTPAGTRVSRIERFVVLALFTAGRRAAVEELRWEQVDLAKGIVHLHLQGTRRTKKRRASVPMHPRLLELLRRAAGERLPEVRGGLSPWVLDHPGSIRSAFRTVAEKAGFGADVTPHVLRHTAATHMLRSGVPIKLVADVLGNTVAMVQRVYGHHDVEALRSAVATIG